MSFVRPAAWTALTAIALGVLSELVAWGLDDVSWEPVARLAIRLDSGSYEVLVSTLVTAEAAFLALFFTTVGVIASTAYQNVPGGLRQLFVEERAGSVYARGVVRSLVFGIAVLAAGAVSYRPHVLSIVLLAALAAIAIFRLLSLGTDLFNFFEPATLSKPLPERFHRAAVQASATETAFDEGTQYAAHTAAADTLRLYRQIVDLMVDRSSHDPSGPASVIRQLLVVAGRYGNLKSSIPNQSRWWAQTPTHPNWLTLDHTRLQMALATNTGVTPELVPDPQWVERDLAVSVARLLRGLTADDEIGTAVRSVDDSYGLLRGLGGQLQADAALTYATSLANSMADAMTPGPDREQLDCLAAAERTVMPLTQTWLGYALAATALAGLDFPHVLSKAMVGPAELYQARLPRSVAQLLERFIDCIQVEVECEGRRVTPQWWLNHYAARALTAQLRAANDAILAEVEPRTVAAVRSAVSAQQPHLAAVIVFAALELLDKIDVHSTRISAAFAALAVFRSEAVGDQPWAEAPDPTAQVADIRQQLLTNLGVCLPGLRSDMHDPTRPDLFGQAYQVLFEATFEALLEGNDTQARQLFAAIFVEANYARDRLIADLSEVDLKARFVYTSEPLVGLLELSGYALLMSELDGAGIWPEVRAWWDRLLASNTATSLPQFLIGLLSALDSAFALTHSKIARSERQQRLSRLLEDRGVTEHDWGWPIRSQPPLPHQSPIVSAFAPGSLGINEELTDLFVVGYLSHRLPEGVELPRSAASLADRIARNREPQTSANDTQADASTSSQPEPPTTTGGGDDDEI